MLIRRVYHEPEGQFMSSGFAREFRQCLQIATQLLKVWLIQVGQSLPAPRDPFESLWIDPGEYGN